MNLRTGKVCEVKRGMTLNPELSLEMRNGWADTFVLVAGHRRRGVKDESRRSTPGSQTASSRHIEKEKTDQAGRRTLGRLSEAVEYAKATLKRSRCKRNSGLGWGPV